MNIGQRIRKLRKEHSLTLVELAEKIQISQPYLSQIERNDKQAPIDVITKVCELFNLSLSEFFSDDESFDMNLHHWIQVGKQLTSEQRQSLLDAINKLKGT